MAFALPLVFASCEKNDEPNVLPDGMSINVYETGDLEVAGNWTSSNEFVATVDKKGKVTTHHVGEAVLTLVDGTQTTSCTITVNPVNTSYTFPSFAWGSDVATIKSLNTNLTLLEELVEDGVCYLSYLTGSSYPGYVYSIPVEGGLDASSIVLDVNDTEAWDDFMYQYFADLEEDEEDEDGWIYLINGNTTAEATIAVRYGLNLDDETYSTIIATFLPLTEETRSGDIKEMFKNLNLEKSILVNKK